MAEISKLSLEIESQKVKEAATNLDRMADSGNQAATTGTKLQSTFAKLRDVMQGPVAAAKMVISAFKQVYAVGKQLVDTYALQEQAVTNLEAVLKATGGTAGLTSIELQNMASELQRVTTFGDETIIAAQSIMLTFKEIGEDVFPGAIEAAMDMATVFGGDLNGKVMQLGKALNDPVEGVSALTRVGIQFTDKQKEMIKAFADTNDLASAQAIIMKEVTSQVGGAARKAGETATGAFSQLSNAFGDMQEKSGQAIAEGLEPFIRKLTEVITEANTASEKINNMFYSGTDTAKAIMEIRDVIALAERDASEFQKKYVRGNQLGLGFEQTLDMYKKRLAGLLLQAEELKRLDAALGAKPQPSGTGGSSAGAGDTDAYLEARAKVVAILQSEQTEYDKIQAQIEELQKTPWASGALENDRLAAIAILRQRQQELLEAEKQMEEDLVIAAWKAGQQKMRDNEAAHAKMVAAAEKRAEKEMELERKVGQIFTDTYATMAMALGEAMVTGEEGWKSFGIAAMNAYAAVMEAMAKEFTIRASAALLTGRFGQAAGYGVLATSAYVAAGAVKTLAMAEGGSGTVDKPTLFLAGEAGKEDFAFVPHSKGGMSGGGTTIIQNIAGSIWTTQQLQSLAVGAVRHEGRGF